MPNNDYIKRENIFPAVTEIAKEIVFGNQDDDKVAEIINSIPAADVEPVIHCKDCIHSCPEKGHETDVHCSWWDYPMPELGFCSKATRKKGEE